METSSERNRIQASFETAALLREAGKGKWLVPRDKLIFAKGKGNMQTYFVHPKTAASRSNTSGSSDENASEVMSEDFKDPALIDKIPTNSTGKVLDRKCQRAADWISEILVRLLKQMVARRIATGRPEFGCSKSVIALAQSMNPETGKQVLDEMHDVIYLPKYDAKAAKKQVDPDSVRLPQKVLDQVRDFVNTIATMYRDNPFHTYNHAAHVTMSVSKLLSRIVAPELVTQAKELDSKLHDHTYGITSDPLTQFAVVFSAMIHDVGKYTISLATALASNCFKLIPLYLMLFFCS